jgi:intracellular sulfur oxidation DsrE/DsrF family protein
MSTNDLSQSTGRRGFIGSLAAGAATIGIANLATPLRTFAEKAAPVAGPGDADAWFEKVKGKHKVVYDSPHPNGVFPFAWPRVFLLTNAATGTPEKDCCCVVVLRHDSIPYAFEDRLWEKYNFGQAFKINDPATGKPAVRNPLWKPAPGTFKVPGFGVIQIGINELQDSGVMFCVCEAAITVNSAGMAEGMKKDAAEVRKDWMAGVLPGIQPVPSGVWALGRAQEKGCGYIYAG